MAEDFGGWCVLRKRGGCEEVWFGEGEGGQVRVLGEGCGDGCGGGRWGDEFDVFLTFISFVIMVF